MKKLLYLFIVVITTFVLHDCMATHTKIFYIPAINLYVKVTANYHTDISYLYLSQNKDFGDNYIKFKSLDKNFPDIPLHYVNCKSVEVYTKELGDNKIKEIKSSFKMNYTSVDSVDYWKCEHLPLIIIYGRGRFISFVNEEKVNEDVVEL
jgi:hypothetical protein